MKRLYFLLLCLVFANALKAQNEVARDNPLRIGIAGLTHTHVHWLLGREKLGDIEIVGIAESDTSLAGRYSRQHGYSMDIVYPSLKEMLAKTKPAAVLAFNDIYGHLEVVKQCAPLGIHVMVEKPMAVSLDHATEMLALAKKHQIHLLTNYETTWYGSNEKAFALSNIEKSIGDIRKIVFYTGHAGPKEIGCNQEFLQWLTDPVLNGGGAITDFGCYGANLSTWLMNGEEPETITAITQQIKPQLYPRVDDDATIIITYKRSQVIIQASWNWPYNRKEMELYGVSGYVFCKDGKNMMIKSSTDETAKAFIATELPAERNDPFIYFKNVIDGNIKPAAYDLSTAGNNEIVVKILEAAKQAAKTGKTVIWKEFYK
jgi:predicted dehydrogenase